MDEATRSSKNRLTLPMAVREALSVVPGGQIRFLPARHGFRPVAVMGDSTAMRGILKGRRRKPPSITAMNEAIAEMGTRPQARAAFAQRPGR